MNALRLLKDDHLSIDGLFDKYRLTKSLWQKEEIVISLVKALSAHIEIETDMLTSPAVKQRSSLEKQVNQFLEAQQLVKLMVKGVGAAKKVADAQAREVLLDAKVDALYARYRPCVDLEETELFPRLEAVLDASELEQLGRKIEKAIARVDAEGLLRAPRR